MAQHSPTKFAPSDWHTANLHVSSSADRQRQIAHDIRQHSQTVRNEIDNKTRWTQYNTDTELIYRKGDVNTWKETLILTLQNIETEISKLNEHKDMAEKAFEQKNMPLEVVLECLAIREHRVSIDLVKDEVETELQKELEVIEGIRNVLHQKINQAFGQLHTLQDCHKILSSDITDKNSALQIDSTCANLTNSADTISMRVDPTRIKKGIVSPQQWESFSSHNVARAQAEMQTSARLREAINQTIHQTIADLEAQWTATNYAFRKRIHELEQTKNELLWQKKNTEKEIADLKEEIQGLEISLAEKLPPMMVVQTRLDNRTHRPNVELCRDQPQYGMVEEVSQIAESVRRLKDKLETAQLALGTLERTLERILIDLNVKGNSLDLDQHCTQIRLKLSEHPSVKLT